MNGPVAIVAGASSGIGQATALRLARAELFVPSDAWILYLASVFWPRVADWFAHR